MKMKKIIFSVTILLSFCGAAHAQNKNPLKLKEGQKFTIESHVNTHSTTEVQGQSMENTADISATYSIVVNSVGDSIKLTNTITGMKMLMSQMGQEMNFDSEKKEDLDGPLGASVKGLLNNPQKVTVSKTGEVADNANGDSLAATNMITKQLGGFEASGFGASMAFMALPAKLKTGDTWTTKAGSDGNLTETTYTVKSISGDLATLSGSGTNSSEIKMEQMGMEMTIHGKGTSTGELLVNITTGVIQSNTTTQDITGTVDAMGQSFPTKTKMTSTTTVKML